MSCCSLQVFDLLQELERAFCELLGGWEGCYVDSVGAAVVAWLYLGHGFDVWIGWEKDEQCTLCFR
jgi:hypothetical protein